MSNFNMTGENMDKECSLTTRQFTNDFGSKSEAKKEGKEPTFGFWDFVLTVIFLFSFFGSIYLYFQNRTLKHEMEEKHKLVMDLKTLLTDEMMMHHAKQSK